MALEVGHILQSKGWTVHYRVCSDLVPSAEISTLIANLYQAPNSATHLNNDRGNDAFPVKGSYPALLIFDQVENLLEGDQSTLVSKFLQPLVDTVLEMRSVRLLLVSRKQIRLADGLAFYVKLAPLSDAAAIQLLQMVSRITSQRDLELIAKGCGCNPLAVTIVRNLLHKGVSEMDIISEMSSGTKRSQKDCFKLPFNSLLEMPNKVQKQMFLESCIEETNCLDEKTVGFFEKEFDPRYSRSRLCTTSTDENKSLKLALSSSASLAGRCLLILIDLLMSPNDEGFCRCFSREQYKLSLGIETSLSPLDLFI